MQSAPLAHYTNVESIYILILYTHTQRQAYRSFVYRFNECTLTWSTRTTPASWKYNIMRKTLVSTLHIHAERITKDRRELHRQYYDGSLRESQKGLGAQREVWTLVVLLALRLVLLFGLLGIACGENAYSNVFRIIVCAFLTVVLFQHLSTVDADYFAIIILMPQWQRRALLRQNCNWFVFFIPRRF